MHVGAVKHLMHVGVVLHLKPDVYLIHRKNCKHVSVVKLTPPPKTCMFVLFNHVSMLIPVMSDQMAVFSTIHDSRLYECRRKRLTCEEVMSEESDLAGIWVAVKEQRLPCLYCCSSSVRGMRDQSGQVFAKHQPQSLSLIHI